MTITHNLKIDLVRPAILPPISVVQGDTYTREVQISLYAAGVPWELPEGHDVAIRYSKPDGTAGKYDTLPDGSMAWRSEGNTVNIMLCPQMLTVPGVVPAQVSIILAERTVSTFTFFVSVAPDASKGALTSENYINWRTAFLPQLTDAKVGQFLVIAEVDEKSRVVAFDAVAAPSGGGGGSGGNSDQSGLTNTEKNAIFNLLKNGVFNGYDATNDLAELANAWGIEASFDVTGVYLNSTSGIAEIDDTFTLVATVKPSTATNKAVEWESSNTAVATVTDNGDGTATVKTIAPGSTIITVTTVDGGYIAVYSLTVQEDVTYYSVTYDLVNATSSNNTASISGGSNFTTNLSAPDGYILANVKVTMGGIDITADVYVNGTIDIESVTGDIAITAEGVSAANTIIVKNGWLDSTTTATSEPTTNAQYASSYCTTAIPVKAGDVVTFKTLGTNSESTLQADCRFRDYTADGVWIGTNITGNSYTAESDGFVRFLVTQKTWVTGIESATVASGDETVTYIAIDNR